MTEKVDVPVMTDKFYATVVFDGVVRFLNGDFPYCPEAIAIGMAIQGAMAVRKGPNKEGKLHWFHAFLLSALAAFAGGTFNFIWMGQPSGILSNDVFMACAIISFVIVNYTPFDIGFTLLKTLPFSLLTVSFAQLFRSLGTIKFLTACFLNFKDSPSKYYPIPVFGPIIYGILLGNMGPLVLKGLEAHIANGVPWPVQNGGWRRNQCMSNITPHHNALYRSSHISCTFNDTGLFVATFYHFFVHDTEGIVGTTLRKFVLPLAQLLGLEDKAFAFCVVSGFMQVMGVLQMPEFLGPSFTPFGSAILTPFFDPSTWTVGKYEGAYAQQQKEKAQQDAVARAAAGAAAASKKKKKKKKTS